MNARCSLGNRTMNQLHDHYKQFNHTLSNLEVLKSLLIAQWLNYPFDSVELSSKWELSDWQYFANWRNFVELWWTLFRIYAVERCMELWMGLCIGLCVKRFFIEEFSETFTTFHFLDPSKFQNKCHNWLKIIYDCPCTKNTIFKIDEEVKKHRTWWTHAARRVSIGQRIGIFQIAIQIKIQIESQIKN